MTNQNSCPNLRGPQGSLHFRVSQFRPQKLGHMVHTPPKFRICARQKVPAKCFKIYHILYIWKPKVAFSVFHLVLLYIFSYFILCYFIFPLMNVLVYVDIDPRAFIREKNKVERNEKWFLVFQNYGKFWSVLLGHFIKHKPLISEECNCRDL